MALSLGSPWLSRVFNPSLPRFLSASHTTTTAFLFLLPGNARNAAATPLLPSMLRSTGEERKRPRCGGSGGGGSPGRWLGGSSIERERCEPSVGAEVIAAENSGGNGGVLSISECCRIMSAAIERDSFDLAMSIFQAMRRSSFDLDKGMYLERWKWSRPDVNTFTNCHTISEPCSCTASVEALKVIGDICCVRISPGEKIWAPKIRPSLMILLNFDPF